MLLLREWEAGSVSSSFRMREELFMDVSTLICLTNIDPSNFDIDLLASSLGLLLEWRFSFENELHDHRVCGLGLQAF